MKTIFVISVICLLNSFSFPQDKRNEFIEALITNTENIEQFIDKDELEKSKRLGINYDSVKYKFLISYDIDEKVKDEIKKNSLKYEVKTQELENEYSLTEFSVPSLNYFRQFYFKKGKWISPVTYFSKAWTVKSSKYFIFKISEPKYFNDYCINKLDEFVDSMAVLLEFTEQQKKLLEEEKIYYVLCKDEKEIEQITGFNTRGIYITAFDEVVTTYNTHYHELAHLLMNYKLKNLSLYTLPFFMEGFAVAVGGRGGIAKRVVLDIGYYLQKSGFLTYDSIITNEGFYKEDASLTYPVAGLYNALLLKELGKGKYIELYKNVNGTIAYLEKIERYQINLPVSSKYTLFLNEYHNMQSIVINKSDTNRVNLYLKSGEIIRFRGLFKKVDNNYKFSILSPFIFSPAIENSIKKDYMSKKYTEITGKNVNYYGGLKYGIVADSQSVSLYNFYTDELIASYNYNFSLNPQQIPLLNGKFEFFIGSDVFENDLGGDIVIEEIGR